MVLVMLAIAVLLWPSTRPARRLRRLAAPPVRRWQVRATTPDALLVVLGCVGGWAAFGLGGALAAGLVGAALCHRWRMTLRQRRQLAELEDLAEAVAGLVADLATGAHPVTAAEQAAQDAPASAAESLRLIATASRLGGDLEINPPQLRQAWHLTARHGVPLMATLTAVAQDLSHQATFTRAVQARLAGPQISTTLLAALPAAALAVGEATGAHPLATLATTTLGQSTLVLGALLTSTGLTWTTRITHRAVPT
ncbi:type II secretion system F family protein [Actinokineospora cianjurensis]|uniref:Tight adherence protein B n=1 Tax=Actinokineospora cianjurensis TaxID=585224 RepID=A0A421B691_9PSEU|nr:hypothetical protein [Actinokineospora cianjurensis]RLK59884.1 tight adherence protein B [Actinokineospora cianjurensis]